jgi:hypothetical protein
MASATWTAPRDWADAYVVTASDLETYLSDNDLYLWTLLNGGIAASIIMENTYPYQAKTSGGVAQWLIGLDGSNDVIIAGNNGFFWKNIAGSTTYANLDTSGDLTLYGPHLKLNSGGGTQYRALRYLDSLSAELHVEFGLTTDSTSVSGNQAITFTHAFASTPTIFLGWSNSQNVQNMWTSSASASGFTANWANNGSGSTHIQIAWMAIGTSS